MPTGWLFLGKCAENNSCSLDQLTHASYLDQVRQIHQANLPSGMSPYAKKSSVRALVTWLFRCATLQSSGWLHQLCVSGHTVSQTSYNPKRLSVLKLDVSDNMWVLCLSSASSNNGLTFLFCIHEAVGKLVQWQTPSALSNDPRQFYELGTRSIR